MEDNLSIDRNYTIKDLPISERPREKLYSYGPESLSNAELLAIIIRTGHKEDTAVEVAQRILNLDNRGLPFLSNVTLEQLTDIKGIGECKAAQILAAIEIGKRINRWKADDKVKVTSPMVIANLMMDEMRYLDKEHFNIAILDTKNQVLSIENISIGTLNASIVHPRDVFNMAIKKNANSIILLHNHPSGDPQPSNEDINITHRLVDVGNLVGIKVLDHIIIGDNRYISFKEKNLF
ncbi:MAG: DNA repair protein RadC [Tissierella sp.]|nr:DNA repair protein RadC [Tissierella sp.]